MSKIRFKIAILALSAALLALASCASPPVSHDVFAMDTLSSFTLYGGDAGKAAGECEALLYAADALWSATREGSDIYSLNHAQPGEKVGVDEKTARLLEACREISDETSGAFDISLYAVSRLWGFESGGRVPDSEEISGLLSLSGMEGMIVEGNEAARKKGVEFDLGAIAKGAAADEFIAVCEKNGVESALASIGGTVVALGEKPGGGAWKIGLRDPDGGSGDYFGYLELNDKVTAVSGDYERYFIEDGVRYHHILDPATGCPARSGLRAVCVVSGSGTLADAYSTALFVLGLEASLKLYERDPRFEAVFLTDGGRIVTTAGIADKFTDAPGGYVYEA